MQFDKGNLMKKIAIFTISIIIFYLALTVIVKGEEWDWNENEGFYNQGEPLDKTMLYLLPIFVIIIGIITFIFIKFTSVSAKKQLYTKRIHDPSSSFIRINNLLQNVLGKKIYCYKCRKIIKDKSKFCPYCGEKFNR